MALTEERSGTPQPITWLTMACFCCLFAMDIFSFFMINVDMLGWDEKFSDLPIRLCILAVGVAFAAFFFICLPAVRGIIILCAEKLRGTGNGGGTHCPWILSTRSVKLATGTMGAFQILVFLFTLFNGLVRPKVPVTVLYTILLWLFVVAALTALPYFFSNFMGWATQMTVKGGLPTSPTEVATNKGVFVSGVFSEGASGSEEAARYAKAMGQWLVESGFHIHNCYGMGLGRELVDGATAAFAKEPEAKACDCIFLYPFPYGTDILPQEMAKLYAALRLDVVKRAGLTILIGGSEKDESGQITVSDSCLEEADMTLKSGHVVIPLAASGWAARMVWESIEKRVADVPATLTNKQLECYLSPEFQALNGNSPDEVFSAATALVGMALKS